MTQEKIIGSNVARFSNVLHTTFHQTMHAIVSSIPAVDQEKWMVKDLLQPWEESIAVEVEINREATASNDTKELQKIDGQRDDLITYIFGQIKFEATNGLLETKRNAAERLMRIVKVYNGLHREGYNEQTTHTDGLVADLSKTQEFQDLSTLGLSAYISQLKSVNDEFKQLIITRSASKAQNKLPAARTQRAVSDAIYKQVCNYLQASYLINATDAERERINLLVRMMNKRTEEIKARYRQTQGQRSGNTNTKGNSTDRPNINPNSGRGSGGTGDNSSWPDGTQRADGE